jgi:acyl-CoA synthetase (NDP forming)
MLDFLFKPKSVAVVGASNRKLTIGYRILENLEESRFTGRVYPVHPKEDRIRDLKTYASILDVPEEVDVAHIVVKSSLVPAILADCAKKKVKSVIINTAGFSEVGDEGAELERNVVEIARRGGVRVFGPNCQGIMNSDPAIRAYCNFTFTRMTEGAISIVAQSGGVGEVINQRLCSLGEGFRMYASNGNAADISIPEIIKYWGDDERTKVIIVHIESLRDPREFMEVAKSVGLKKPVLGMKTGRTREGARAVASHTGRLMGEEIPIELIFKECGIVSFNDQDELCQAAIAFGKQPLPRGNRVAIVTNSGGPGIIATDGCIESGLELPELSPETQKSLKDGLFPEATVSNPVDVLATATPEHYGLTLRELVRDANIDSVLVNFITPFFVDCESVAREIVDAARSSEKPVLSVIMTDKDQQAETLRIIKDGGVPTYDFAETATKALRAMVRMREYREDRQEPSEPLADVDRERARAIVASARARKREMLTAEESIRLLGCYRLPFVRTEACRDTEECVKAAGSIGFPVALKIDSSEVAHKTEAGGLSLDVRDEGCLKEEIDRLKNRFRSPAQRYVVQEYVTGGTEVIVGCKRVEGVGHVVMFGLGGVLVEIMKDVVFRFAPLTKRAAFKMIRSARCFPILQGYRGRETVDTDRLAEILVRTSQLVIDIPDIQELDLNPIIAFGDPSRTAAVDVLVRVSP